MNPPPTEPRCRVWIRIVLQIGHNCRRRQLNQPMTSRRPERTFRSVVVAERSYARGGGESGTEEESSGSGSNAADSRAAECGYDGRNRWCQDRCRADERGGYRCNGIRRRTTRTGVRSWFGLGFDVVHRTDSSVTVIAGALGFGAADGGLRTQGRRDRHQQAEMEYEPAASNAREARP